MPFSWKQGKQIKSICPYCEATNYITPSDWSCDTEGSDTGEDRMGEEYQHQTNMEVTCVNCEKDYSSYAIVFEYPVGVFNGVECSEDLDASDVEGIAIVEL